MRRLLTTAAILFCIGFMPLAAVMIAGGAALIVWSMGGVIVSAAQHQAIGHTQRPPDPRPVGRAETVAWAVLVGLSAIVFVVSLVQALTP